MNFYIEIWKSAIFSVYFDVYLEVEKAIYHEDFDFLWNSIILNFDYFYTEMWKSAIFYSDLGIFI